MNIREYNEDKDFEQIRNWSVDERTHALWCAGRFAFPLQKDNFHEVLADIGKRHGDRPFVAVGDDGKPEGFFCYSLNKDTNEGFLKFVIVDPQKRGKGLGKKMIGSAVRYGIGKTGADAVGLIVFDVNEQARKCYEGAGFKPVRIEKDPFIYNDEAWGRCRMEYRSPIRKVRPEDIPACSEIIRKSFKTVADEFGFTEENAPRFTAFAMCPERIEYWMNEQKRPMYIYEDGGIPAGFYSLLVNDNGECELGSISVLPDHRHKGIGKSLLDHSVRIAGSLGCNTMNLSIVEENKVLRKWYEDNGAVHIRTQRFDFFPFTCGYMKIRLDQEI